MKSPAAGRAERVSNVAHLLPYTGVGGTEHETLNVARAVAPAGYRSLAFCLPEAGPVQQFFSEAGLETVAWSPGWPQLRYMGAFLRRAVHLAREFRRRDIRLVHCADLWPAASTGAVAAKLAGIPVLCHIRNRQERISLQDRRCLRLVDRWAFVSRDTWRSFGYPVPDPKGRVVYDAVALGPEKPDTGTIARIRREVRREFGLADDAPLLGMVARVEPQKDFDTLARAAARVVVARPDAHFLVVGGTDQTPEQRAHYPEVLRRVEADQIGPHITFAGFRTDVRRLLQAMDVFVLSTNWEGLPLSILEAMAESKPVIATDVDGVHEAVVHGETGLLSAHADDAALAEHILALLHDPNGARNMGEAGRRRVAARFSTERFTADIVGLYREVLGRPSEPERQCPG